MDNAFPVHESTRKRRRWGCACGCAIFLIGLVFGAVGLSIYLFQKNRPAPAERWMTATTTALAVVRLDPGDSGLADMLRQAENAAQQAATAAGNAAPASAVTPARIAAFGRSAQFLLFPDVFLYLSRDAAAGRENVLGAAQLRYRVSWLLARVFLNAASGRTPTRVGNAELFAIQAPGSDKPSAFFALTPSALLFSEREEPVRKAAAAVKDPPADEQGSEGLQRYTEEMNLRQPPEGEDLGILAANDTDRFGSALKWVEDRTGATGLRERLVRALAAQRVQLTDIQAARVSCDIASADRAKVTVSLHFQQADTAKKAADALRAALAALVSSGGEGGLGRKVEVRAQGSAAVVTFEITGLKAWMRDTLTTGGTSAAPATGGSAPAPGN